MSSEKYSPEDCDILLKSGSTICVYIFVVGGSLELEGGKYVVSSSIKYF